MTGPAVIVEAQTTTFVGARFDAGSTRAATS